MDQHYVCCMKGQVYDQKNTIPTVKHGVGAPFFLRQEPAVVYLALWMPEISAHFKEGQTLLIIGLSSKTMIPSTLPSLPNLSFRNRSWILDPGVCA